MSGVTGAYINEPQEPPAEAIEIGMARPPTLTRPHKRGRESAVLKSARVRPRR